MACTKTQLGKAVAVFFLIIFFYTSSISLTFYNKWMSKRYRFPLTVSMVHFIVVFLISALLRKLWESYKGEKRVVLDWDTYLKRISPSAIAGSLDIGFSNWSIMLSTVSLYTMAKSSTILFVTFFSILLHIEKLNWQLCFVVVCISCGLFLFTYESKQFSFPGFSLAILASVMGGIRWTTAQIVMQKEGLGLRNPIDAIYHIQPIMAVIMVFLAFSVEGKQVSGSKLLFNAPSASIAATSIFMMLIGALLAFVLTVSEFLLVSNTSGITLSIAGIFKEVCTLTLAAEFGGDKWGVVNFLGLVICMIGISVHVVSNALKGTEVRGDHKEDIALVSLLQEAHLHGNESDAEEITMESTVDSKLE